jgi:multiple sugar transport system substrate-binding protein
MKLSKFQFIFFGIFFVFIIAGVIAFATFKSSSSTSALSAITIWGTFPKDRFDQYVSKANQSLTQPLSISYTEKDSDSFNRELVQALARGTGPDAILISADNLYPNLDKVVSIPYSVLNVRTFKDSYVEAGELYMKADGIVGIPFTIDPLVMYWNRDTFASAGLATYPRYWEDFGPIISKLTIKDNAQNIKKTAIALGDFTNVSNAREIFGSVLFQIGNPVTSFGINKDVLETTIKNTVQEPSAQSVSDFFVQFVNPNNSTYSWNRGMMNDKSAFLGGYLSTYFGFASEIKDIASKNPNLNFDIAPLPQLKNGVKKAVYGKMYGFSILKASQSQNAAYQIVSVLTSPQILKDLSDSLYLPSVRRDIISLGSNDPYISIFNTQALIAKTWLDSSPEDSRRLMSSMISSITSGAKKSKDAIRDFEDSYDIILRNAIQ